MSNFSNNARESIHGLWSSRMTFILAVTGSAVGLGNIWKFPYIAGSNGGGAFVLVYLICILLIGFPIMVSEILLGRKGRRNPITSMQLLGQEERGNKSWMISGFIGLFAGFLILSYYSVIAGWTLHYFTLSITGTFNNLDNGQVNDIFSSLTSSISTQALFHTVFMLLTIIIIAKGIKNGLEKAVKLMMPALLVIMLILLIYSITQGDFIEGVEYLLFPDFSKINAESILAAMGQAFFTLSLGMGCIFMYGAYLPKNVSIVRTTATIIICDTFVALMSGLIIFPIVFQFDLDPAGGPGLIFLTLPLAFNEILGGTIFAALFFILLSFAAITSALSLLEPSVAWLIENSNVTRRSAAVIIGGTIWLLGFCTIFSFNILQDFTFFEILHQNNEDAKGTLFDNFDYISSNILLPVSGLLFTLFAGWFMRKESTKSELSDVTQTSYNLWLILAKYVAPIGVIFILLNSINKVFNIVLF
tara:strand:- start:1881 stop:3302 length:1422 start_codon:yes stop_codon:yes gene_type:complete